MYKQWLLSAIDTSQTEHAKSTAFFTVNELRADIHFVSLWCLFIWWFYAFIFGKWEHLRVFICLIMMFVLCAVHSSNCYHLHDYLHVSVSGVSSGHFLIVLINRQNLTWIFVSRIHAREKEKYFTFFIHFIFAKCTKNYSKLIYSEKCFPMTLYWTLWTCPKLSEAKSQNIDYSHLWSMYDLPLGLGYKVLNCRSTHMGITSLRWVMAHSPPLARSCFTCR